MLLVIGTVCVTSSCSTYFLFCLAAATRGKWSLACGAGLQFQLLLAKSKKEKKFYSLINIFYKFLFKSFFMCKP